MPGGGGPTPGVAVSGVIGQAAITPVLAAASVRAEQVTQLVMGETAVVRERTGDWIRITTAADAYDGWVHRGYVRMVPAADAETWRAEARVWWEGGVLVTDDGTVTVPLRARLRLAGEAVRLPDGRTAHPGALEPRTSDAVALDARRTAPAWWALERFRGAPYLWGGLTPWGVDCSGLVQTTHLARGTVLPRDASRQIEVGAAVALDAIQPGDLLFFHGEGSAVITHVAFAADGDSIVHSTIACGGVVHEPFTAGTRAGDALRPRLVAARRLAAEPAA